MKEIEIVAYVALLGLFLVVVVPNIISAFTEYIYPMWKPDYPSLSGSIKDYIEFQFDSFINNIEACKANPKDQCMCNNVFPIFGKSFNDFEIKIQQRNDIIITLLYKKSNYVVKTAVINDIYLAFVYSTSSGVVDEGIVENEKLIKIKDGKISIFRKSMFIADDEIISAGLYKLSDSRFGMFRSIEGIQISDSAAYLNKC
jgi:hypothetical protein